MVIYDCTRMDVGEVFSADSGDWRGCALIAFNIYGDGRALNRSAQRTLVCCMRLPIRELAAGGQRSWPLTIRPYLCKLPGFSMQVTRSCRLRAWPRDELPTLCS